MVLSDADDNFAKEMTRHLNMSFLYYIDQENFDGLIIEFLHLPVKATENDGMNYI